MLVIPVTFAPGRARLSTRPAITGSVTPIKTTGIAPAAAFFCSQSSVSHNRHKNLGLLPDQLSRMFRKTVKIAAFVTRFDENVLSFDVTMISQRLPKSVQTRCVGSSRNASQIDHRGISLAAALRLDGMRREGMP